VKYTRRARVVAGVAYFLIPVAVGWSPSPPCGVGQEGVALLLASPEAGLSGEGVVPAGGIERGEMSGSSWKGRHGTAFGVVPDGVAKVTVRYPARHGGSTAVTVAAVENLWVAKAPLGPVNETPIAIRSVTWRSAHGKVLKTLREKF
jgi:hypothetical protein